MTDEEFVFHQTSFDRKKTARSARSRKTHNGKSGCTLPHERMTKEEVITMNGPVESINLNRPIRNWDNFKALPSSLQEVYVAELRKKYDISMTNFAEMFGIHPTTLSKYCMGRAHLKFNRTTSLKTPERKAKLEAFRKWAGIIQEEAPAEAAADCGTIIGAFEEPQAAETESAATCSKQTETPPVEAPAEAPVPEPGKVPGYNITQIRMNTIISDGKASDELFAYVGYAIRNAIANGTQVRLSIHCDLV